MSARNEPAPLAALEITATEETRGPEVRLAIALKDVVWVENGQVNRLRAGEQMPVVRGSALWQKICDRRISVWWANDIDAIVPCPGRVVSVSCGAPLLKSEVRAGTLLRRNLRRATRALVVPHQGQLFQLAAGDVAEQKFALHMVDDVVANVLPESFTVTSLALFRVTCPSCSTVDVAVEEEG